MSGKRIILSRELLKELAESGIVPQNCKRVIVDISADGVAMVYSEVYGDQDLLSVLPAILTKGLTSANG